MSSLSASWLEIECGIIPGLTRAVMVGQSANDDCLEACAVWPQDLQEVPDELLLAARSAAEKGTAVVRATNAKTASGQPVSVFAAPLRGVDGARGAAAVEVEGEAARQHQVVLQLLGWGGEWYELLQSDVSLGGAGQAGSQLAVLIELLVGTLEHERFGAAATTAVTEIAGQLRCDRVSLGLLKGRSVEIHAVSNNAVVETRANLMRDVAAAMEEAIDQDASVVFPALESDAPLVSFAQEVLSERTGESSVCSTPLYSGGRCVGALTLERSITRPFDRRTVLLCESLGALLGPICSLKYKQDRFIGWQVLEAFTDFVRRLIGPKHYRLKLAGLSIALATTVLATVDGEYRIRADASLEPLQKRVMAASQAGFLDSVHARAGDEVAAGQVVATLDARELELEALKLRSELERFSKEQRTALARRERSSAAIAVAQMQQVEARLALVEEQLGRTQIKAPFEGILVSGDLSQSLGAPVEVGQTLFEIAPLEAYRVQIEVDERDVGELRQGQTGQLALAGLPDRLLDFEVERVLPVANAAEGASRFRVEAQLSDTPAVLRPGMQGVAKIAVGERRLAWIWAHRFINWARLRIWHWTG